MAAHGYARVCAIDQNLTSQEQALRMTGRDVIRAEMASGTRWMSLSELETLLHFFDPAIRWWSPGSTGSHAASKTPQDIVHKLKARNVTLNATEQPVDTGSAAGEAFLDMLRVFAEFETNLRRERQLDGVALAKRRGVVPRAPAIDRPRRGAALARRGSRAERDRTAARDRPVNGFETQWTIGFPIK